MPLEQSSTPAGSQPTATAPPAASAPTGTPVVGVQSGNTMIGLETKLTTKAEVDAMRQRRSYISDNLNSAQNRRDGLVRELRKSPDGVARTGIEQRLQFLDQRILRLEQDLDAASKAIAGAPLSLAAAEEQASRLPPGRLSSGQITGISIVGTLAIGLPLAIAAARVMLRRASVPRPTPQVLESAARLERMEQAIDAVAVEVERISEGQRFVTQLMAGKPAEQPLLVERKLEVGQSLT